MAGDVEECRYSLLLQWDASRDLYVATVPELADCRAIGATWEEAIQSMHAAVGMALADLRKTGKVVPKPRLYGQHATWHALWSWITATRRRRGLVLAVV